MELVMRKRDVNSYRNSEFNTLERALKLSPEQNTRSERASTRPITRAKHSGKHSSQHSNYHEQSTREAHSSQHSRPEINTKHANQHACAYFLVHNRKRNEEAGQLNRIKDLFERSENKKRRKILHQKPHRKRNLNVKDEQFARQNKRERAKNTIKK